MAELLITCEHASHTLPGDLDLGLSEAVMLSHVSRDQGAGDIARCLAERSGAPLHVGVHSRLWVDLNRRESNPDVIVEQTYGIAVPGNVGLSAEARADRLERFHRPYREAARADATRMATRGLCLHLSIHSFDPALDPPNRDFDVGVLFDPERSPERQIAPHIADGLEREGWRTRLNEPYLGTPEGLTSWLRGQLPSESYVGLEVECSYAWSGDPPHTHRFVAALLGVINSW